MADSLSPPVKFQKGVLPFKIPGYDADALQPSKVELLPQLLAAPLPISNSDEFLAYLPARARGGGGGFTDDFDRADGAVGNGWTAVSIRDGNFLGEHDSGVPAIADGAVHSGTVLFEGTGGFLLGRALDGLPDSIQWDYLFPLTSPSSSLCLVSPESDFIANFQVLNGGSGGTGVLVLYEPDDGQLALVIQVDGAVLGSGSTVVVDAPTGLATLKLVRAGDHYTLYLNDISALEVDASGSEAAWGNTVVVGASGSLVDELELAIDNFLATVESPDVLALARLQVSSTGGLTALWHQEHPVTDSSGHLAVLASCVTDNRFIAVLSHKTGDADPVLKIHSYGLDDGVEIGTGVELVLTQANGLGMSLFAHTNGVLGLFWADTTGLLRAQSIAVSGLGNLSLGSSVALHTAAGQMPLFVQQLKAGTCALYVPVAGGQGSIYEVRNTGVAQLVSQIDGIGGGDGTDTQFVALTDGGGVTRGLALAMHESADFLWGTVDWVDGAGFDNWQSSVDAANAPTVDTSSDVASSGNCPPGALDGEFMYFGYMKDTIANRPWQMVFDIFDFANLPASLVPTWIPDSAVPESAAAASAVSDQFQSSLAPVSADSITHDVLPGPAAVRSAVVGDDWVIVMWLAADAPYCLVVSTDLTPPMLTAQPITRGLTFS